MFFRAGINFYFANFFIFWISVCLFVYLFCLLQYLFTLLECIYCDEKHSRKKGLKLACIHGPTTSWEWLLSLWASCYLIVSFLSSGLQSIREATSTTFERRWQNSKYTHFSSSDFSPVIILEPKETYYLKHPSLENSKLQCENGIFQHSRFCADFHRGMFALLSPHHLWLIENSSLTSSFSENNGNFIYFRNFCHLLKFPLFLNYCFLASFRWFKLALLHSCPTDSAVCCCCFSTFKNTFLSPSATLHSIF